jgi:Tol biopolymer transport system component
MQRYTIMAPDSVASLHSFALSPDGRYIAISAIANGKRQLWLRPLDGMRAQVMPGTDDATFPFWSPDNRFIGFFAQGKLKKVGANGGPPQSLCDAPDGRGGSWNREDVIVFTPYPGRGAIQRISASGGVPVDVTERIGFSLFPFFLPDDRHFLYLVNVGSPEQRGIHLGSLGSKAHRRVLADTSSVIYASGRLLFIRENILMAMPFDIASGQTIGDASPLAEAVSPTTLVNYAPVSVSGTGMLLYESGTVANNQMAWYDRAGKFLKPVGAPGPVLAPAISPDEKLIVYSNTRASTGDLWLRNLARGIEQRFTTNDPFATAPFWSPHGDRIAFTSSGGGGFFNLYDRAANGSGHDEPLVTSANDKVVSQWPG